MIALQGAAGLLARPASWLSGILRSGRFVPLCLLTSLVVRLLWVGLVPSVPVSDFGWYYQRGLEIAGGGGFAVGGSPTAYWPVGYPAFLGLVFYAFGPHLIAAKLANVLMHIGILILSYLIARNVFSSELTGRLTLLVLAFHPNQIAYGSLLSTECLFLLLLLVGVWMVLGCPPRPRAAIAAGAAFGLACLVKPQVLPVPLLLITMLHLRGTRHVSMLRLGGSVLIVYATILGTISPWIARNYVVFGDLFYISNNGGVTLFIGNNPHANGTYIPIEDLEHLLGPTLDERSRDVQASRYAVDYALRNPVRTIGLWPAKLYYTYNEDVEGVTWNAKGLERIGPGMEIFLWWFTGLAQNYYLCIIFAFLAYLVIVFMGPRRRNSAPPAIGLAVIGYFTFVCLVTIGISRFHFPLVPWMVMYIASLGESILSPPLTGRSTGQRSHQDEQRAAGPPTSRGLDRCPANPDHHPTI